MSNKRRSSMPAVETLVEEKANKRQRTSIPTITTTVKAVESMDEMENKEKTQIASLPSQNLSNMEIDCQLSKFPQEILRMICSHVDPHELPNLRFVSRDFSSAAVTHMFKELSFKFEASSFQNLSHIARSAQLRHHVLKLTCKGQFTMGVYIEDYWSLPHVEYHFLHQRELAEVFKRLPSLNTIRIDTNHCDAPYEYSIITNGSFDTFWNFLKSALVNVSNLRAIELYSLKFESNIFKLKRSPTAFSKREMKKLEILKDFHLSLNHSIIDQVPALLNCMQNLRSLSLEEASDTEQGHWDGTWDISQSINPSTVFPSLESLTLKGFLLNQQYFQEFLLNNANSLRSLKLENVSIESTKEEFDSKEHLKSNPWIRMFYFFAQSLHLEKIELFGELRTSFSGLWSSACLCRHTCDSCRSSTLMLSLQNFITHVEGSSFPSPHPDEDLRHVDMQRYYPRTKDDVYEGATDPGFYLLPQLAKRGEIRLLEREPFKTSTFKSYMPWTEPESDSDSDDNREVEEEEEEGEWEDEEDEEEEEIPNRPDGNSPRHSAFDYTITQIRANRNLWNDEERNFLMNTLLEGFMEDDE
ncbi:hypothetical protein BTUL_0010g01090 [Botrytis tulipae]|uniref:F-box domain-containing protein n=1 Tax=Botrytis tulipae TaxID=87230 RepID=A0A4Z1F4F4_9HELO|nr:hypothetical protein BTUL_0010g01090 [Botrytis tulipae]